MIQLESDDRKSIGLIILGHVSCISFGKLIFWDLIRLFSGSGVIESAEKSFIVALCSTIIFLTSTAVLFPRQSFP